MNIMGTYDYYWHLRRILYSAVRKENIMDTNEAAIADVCDFRPSKILELLGGFPGELIAGSTWTGSQ